MDAAEIIVREMQSASGLQVRQLLRESVRQARKSAHLHSHGKVLPLDVGRAYPVRVAVSHLGYDLLDRVWGILRRAVMLAVVAIELDKLREVYLRAERILDMAAVEDESIRGQLNTIGQPLRQIVDEIPGGFLRALADRVDRHQLGFFVHRDEYPLVASSGESSFLT